MKIRTGEADKQMQAGGQEAVGDAKDSREYQEPTNTEKSFNDNMPQRQPFLSNCKRKENVTLSLTQTPGLTVKGAVFRLATGMSLKQVMVDEKLPDMAVVKIAPV